MINPKYKNVFMAPDEDEETLPETAGLGDDTNTPEPLVVNGHTINSALGGSGRTIAETLRNMRGADGQTTGDVASESDTSISNILTLYLKPANYYGDEYDGKIFNDDTFFIRLYKNAQCTEVYQSYDEAASAVLDAAVIRLVASTGDIEEYIQAIGESGRVLFPRSVMLGFVPGPENELLPCVYCEADGMMAFLFIPDGAIKPDEDASPDPDPDPSGK